MQNINKDEINNFHIPRWNEIPNIGLYVDQVMCFLDESLSNCIDKEKKGHVLTKTMINNYVKNEVILPTVNKKYNREHIANLFIICILKQIFSINDITQLIKMSIKNAKLEDVYNSFCNKLEIAIKGIFKEKENNSKRKKFWRIRARKYSNIIY